jgi:hypothetical protein
MSILGVLLVLVIAGVALYLVNTYVPMAPPIKTVVVVVIALVVWLLSAYGLLDGAFGPHHRGLC